jgi:hypothetical protein
MGIKSVNFQKDSSQGIVYTHHDQHGVTGIFLEKHSEGYD